MRAARVTTRVTIEGTTTEMSLGGYRCRFRARQTFLKKRPIHWTAEYASSMSELNLQVHSSPVSGSALERKGNIVKTHGIGQEEHGRGSL